MNYFDVKIIYSFKSLYFTIIEKGKIFSNYKKINLLLLRIKPFSLLKINKIYLEIYSKWMYLNKLMIIFIFKVSDYKLLPVADGLGIKQILNHLIYFEYSEMFHNRKFSI